MSIQANYATPLTGAPASYHVVVALFLDAKNNSTFATVESYVDKANHDAGKSFVYTQQIQLNGLPASGSDSFVSAQEALVAAQPTDGTASTAPNRYIFAGGALVDMPS